MSENLRLYTAILFGFEHVLRLGASRRVGATRRRARDGAPPGRRTRDGASSTTSPPAAAWAHASMRSVTLDDFAGVDPLETFRQIRDRYLDGHRSAGRTADTGQVVARGDDARRLPRAGCDADTLVHTWDIARAAGVDETLDPGAVRRRATPTTSAGSGRRCARPDRLRSLAVDAIDADRHARQRAGPDASRSPAATAADRR